MSNVYKKALMLKAENNSFRTMCSYVLLKYEQFGKTKNITLSPLTPFLSEKQRFFIAMCDSENNFCVYPLPPDNGNTVNISDSRSFNAENGFCAAIFSIKPDKDDFYDCESCFFGYGNDNLPHLSQLKNNFLQKITAQYNKKISDEQITSDDNLSGKHNGEDTINDSQAHKYDDEAIADENYFLKENFNDGNVFSHDFNTRITQEKEKTLTERDSREPLHKQTSCDKTNEQKSTNTQTDNCNPLGNETAESACLFKNDAPQFYRTVKDKIDDLFLKNPPIDSLSQLIPDSKWIKFVYKNSGFYIVGIIYKNNLPKYIAYGVPGEKDIKPKGFKQYTLFIPESFFNLNQGYWCIFQNAETGEREKTD